MPNVPSDRTSLPHRTGTRWGPYLEWGLEYPQAQGNRFDVIATAVFEHSSGETKRSLMFYSGVGDTWKFRFTGTEVGEWTVSTTGPGPLDGRRGTVTIVENPDPTARGFIKAFGNKWGWEGTGKVFVPQLAMVGAPSCFLRDGRVDTQKIDRVISGFLVRHGFSGLHVTVAGQWYDVDQGVTLSSDSSALEDSCPDVRTFGVLEALIGRLYERGDMVHLWMWGIDSTASHRRGLRYLGGPTEIGGPLSKADRRILRYIAGRLGPLPAWSIGYGIDLENWADAEQLQAWYDFLKDQLGGWRHYVGGRAHPVGRSVSTCYWHGDYAGYTSVRPSYDEYIKTLSNVPDLPAFQEDRFRTRLHNSFFFKDYDPNLTIRGLWHSTMAGGVANIWGNVIGGIDQERTVSWFYDGERPGIDIVKQIKTYATFFFDKVRFRRDLVPDNSRTDYEGRVMLERWGGGDLNVCLRSETNEHFIFYKENCRSVRMDLSGIQFPLRAVAVDVFDEYQEIDLGELEPESQTWTAPYRSTWAVAVGDFASGT